MKFTLVRFDEIGKDGTLYPSDCEISLPKGGIDVTLDGEIVGKIYEDMLIRTKDKLEYSDYSAVYAEQKEWERIITERIKKFIGNT